MSSSTRERSTLLVACGNTLRRDDGVAREVAVEVESLELPSLQVVSCDLLLPELADPVSKASQVIFVDAVADSTRPTRIDKVSPAESPQILAHHASPEIILALARDVFGHSPTAYLVTIPAEDFGIGEGLSPLASRGKQEALRLICEQLGATRVG
jgi:hydrogenase maturation protease